MIETSERNEGLDRATAGRIGLGVLLFGAGIAVFVAEPDWMPGVTGGGAALVGAGVALVVTNLWNARKRASGVVQVDERVETISRKAAYRSYQITVTLEGILLAVVGLTTVDVDALAVLGLLFVVTSFSYLGYYYWFSRRM